MKANRFYLCFGLSVLLTLVAHQVAATAVEPLQFASPAQAALYDKLANELRCPKCQNQTIGESDAPIAKDLRQKVHELVTQNKTEEDIVNFMVSRYGHFINYRPPVNEKTYILWFAPAMFFAVIVLIFVIRGLRKRAV